MMGLKPERCGYAYVSASSYTLYVPLGLGEAVLSTVGGAFPGFAPPIAFLLD